jgi:hypothetical protein
MENKKKYGALIVLASLVVPGSGHVLMGKSLRGLLFVFWMAIMGYLTWQLTTPAISLIGRLSGGLAVWAISVLEVGRFNGFK